MDVDSLIALHDDAFVCIAPVPYNSDLTLFMTQRGRFFLYSEAIGGYYELADKRSVTQRMATDWRKSYRENVVDSGHVVDPDSDVAVFGDDSAAISGYERGFSNAYDRRGFLSAVFDPRSRNRPHTLYVARTMDMAEYHGDEVYEFGSAKYDQRYDHYLVIESYQLTYTKTAKFRNALWPPGSTEDIRESMTLDISVAPKMWLAVPHQSRLRTGMQLAIDVAATAKDHSAAVLLVGISDGGTTKFNSVSGEPTSGFDAQDYSEFRGKILRIDVSRYVSTEVANRATTPYGDVQHYRIPRDNPFASGVFHPAAREVLEKLKAESHKHGVLHKRISMILDQTANVRPEIWVAGIHNISGMDTHPLTHEQIYVHRTGEKSSSPSAKLDKPIETIIALGHRGRHHREGVFVVKGGENLSWPYKENGTRHTVYKWKSIMDEFVPIPSPILYYEHADLIDDSSIIVTGAFFSEDSYICGDTASGPTSVEREAPPTHGGKVMFTRLTEYDFRNDKTISDANIVTTGTISHIMCIGRNSNTLRIYLGSSDSMGPHGPTSVARVEDPQVLFRLQCQPIVSIDEDSSSDEGAENQIDSD